MISASTFGKKDFRDIILAAIMFSLAFPPIPLGFLIYFTFLPLINLFIRNNTLHSFQKGYVFGLIINLLAFYWLAPYSVFNFSLIVLLNALQYAFFGAIFSHLYRMNANLTLTVWPLIWTALEYLRQFGDLAFTWLNIAYTHSYFLTLIQICDITGYLGITFWIVLVNALLYFAWLKHRQLKKMIIPLGIVTMGFTLLVIYGNWQLGHDDPCDRIRISVIQPNIAPKLKWEKEFREENLKILLSMTDTALADQPDLIIWPETALPYLFDPESRDVKRIRNHVNLHRYNLLLGTLGYEMLHDDTLRYNSAVLIRPDQNDFQAYNKLRLVPKEEGIPFQKQLTFLNNKKIFRRFLYPGDEPRMLHFYTSAIPLADSADQARQDKKLGVLICSESIFPELARIYSRNKTDLLAVITNDAWFGRSAQPYLHSQIAIFRAIENRKSLVQCANSGVSIFIDQKGRVRKKTGIFGKTVVTEELPLNQKSTIYVSTGDWMGCLALSLTLISYIYIRLRRDKAVN